ncbi:MAG: S49 family peptidase [Alphaproteobacteria bacterium]|nr:S49 family peptidase [Alphaproteobacteria bacterium]
MKKRSRRKSKNPIIRLVTLDFIRNPQPKVAILPLKGVIGSVGKLRGKGLVADELRDTIKKAFALSGLKAVAVVINSPGGSPVQSSLIFNIIRECAEEKDVPVVAFAEDVCASGGYWLACAGDEIYANAASIVGSIGVVASGFGLQEFIKKHGIERRVYTQGENKVMLDPFLPEKEEDVNRLLAVQRDVHEAFKALVLKSRGKRLNADGDELFSGAFWSGAQAKDMGLVDGLGDVYTVMKERYGEQVKLVPITAKKPFLGGLLGSRLSSAHWTDELLSSVEERSIWHRFGL